MTFKPGKLIAFDTEGTGLDVPHRDAPFAVSLCNEAGDSWYCEWDVDPKTRKVKPVQADLMFLRKILRDTTIEKVAHNTPYDIRALQAHRVIVKPPYHDTLIETKRAKSNLFNYGLKPLAKKFLDTPDDDEEELKEAVRICRRAVKRFGWNLGAKVQQDYWLPRAVRKHHPSIFRDKLPSDADELCMRYCLMDSERCMLLHLLMQSHALDKEARAGYEREMELMPIVIEMMGQGWRVHLDKVQATRESLEDDIRGLKRELNKWADSPLLKWTNATIAGLVYDDLELKSFDGKRSVDREHLEKTEHPVADLILRMRDADGCITKFLNCFDRLAVKEKSEHILYPNFNQAGAKTFRFSATRPPIQTIPDASKSKSNMSARQCIGPRVGQCWYMIDYSSLQVRIFADLAQDKTMLAALRDGIKPHAAAARICWNGEGNKSGLRMMSNTVSLIDHRTKVEEFCDEFSLLRLLSAGDWTQIAEALLDEFDYDIINAETSIGAQHAYATAKTSFFARLFGAGVIKTAKTLGCSVPEARQSLRDYDRSLPRIKSWSLEIQNYGMRHGYILTPYGDKIHLDPTFEYRGVNYIVQGAEAAFVKDRMIAVDRIIAKSRFRLIGQIHDELAFTAPSDTVSKHKPMLRRIKRCLEDHTGHFGIEMPCKIDRVNRYWNDRKAIKV